LASAKTDGLARSLGVTTDSLALRVDTLQQTHCLKEVEAICFIEQLAC
jgi:hypothetical protein